MLNPQTLPKGQEQHESFCGASKKRLVQYDYRDTDGELFSCISETVKQARARRDKWLEKRAGK